MRQVYLESSFFSACVTTRTDAKSTYWQESSLEWWTTQSRLYELCISPEVIVELSDPDFAQRDAALAMVKGLTLLDITAEVVGLAQLLIREKLVPGPIAGDAIHLAVAIVHEMDYLLSWNVKHLANPNKRDHLNVVCLRLGLLPPQIITPDMLQEPDNG